MNVLEGKSPKTDYIWNKFQNDLSEGQKAVFLNSLKTYKTSFDEWRAYLTRDVRAFFSSNDVTPTIDVLAKALGERPASINIVFGGSHPVGKSGDNFTLACRLLKKNRMN